MRSVGLFGRGMMNGVKDLPERHRNAPPEETLYEPIEWRSAGDYSDILYEKAEGIAKVTICLLYTSRCV